MNKKYTIGIDFGTLSGRAMIVCVNDGEEIYSSVYAYPHAVMDKCLPSGKILPSDFALQHPADYIEVLSNTIPELLEHTKISPDDIIGIGIDFTACTMIPVDKSGKPLCFYDELIDEPNAYVKLWKHHAAQKYATLINEKAKERQEEWISDYGGQISSEWLFPKIWQILDESPEIYDKADYFIEACDWIIWQMTGIQKRSTCTAGYKAIWSEKAGYPSPEFFESLDRRLKNVVKEKLDAPLFPVGQRAGSLTEKMAKLTGLRAGTAVAIGNVDAHVAAPSLKISESGKLLAVMGTSTSMLLLSDKYNSVPGICGVVKDGVIPGFWGYEAGQTCVGDHFAWFCDNLMPESYKNEAKQSGLDDIAFMMKKAEMLLPGESGIIALDWWNGNRSVLVDADLNGLFLGMTLATKPEDMFRALVEATAFGARMIFDNYREHGIAVDEIYASGGIAEKNSFLVQMYSDVTGLAFRISGSPQAPALGSAIFASIAAGKENGGWGSIKEAADAMGKLKNVCYKPDNKRKLVYDKLYNEYLLLHDYFGRGANDCMKRIKNIRKEVKQNVFQ